MLKCHAQPDNHQVPVPRPRSGAPMSTTSGVSASPMEKSYALSKWLGESANQEPFNNISAVEITRSLPATVDEVKSGSSLGYLNNLVRPSTA